MDLLNFRSDTQTLPSPAMRQAMADAVVGDDTYGEDPTVLRLESMVAERLGKQAALFVLSGTMGNLIALMTHCQPSDELFVDANAHVVRAESGGLSSVAGVLPTAVASKRGHLIPAALAAAVRAPDIHQPRARLVWLENTHNLGGGSVMAPSDQREVEAIVARHGLVLHVDGARLFNAATALCVEAATLVEHVDSAMIDLTKGLGCPMGALLVGERAFIEEARFRRRRIGGGMRQAGVVAACGVVALDTQVDRLAEDHEVAAWLAREVATIDGYELEPSDVETNMVYVDVSRLGHSRDVVTALARRGLLVSGRPPGHIRLVTHLQVPMDAAREAVHRLRLAANELRLERGDS